MGEIDNELDQMTASLQIPMETISIKDESGETIGGIEAYSIIGDDGFHIVGLRVVSDESKSSDFAGRKQATTTTQDAKLLFQKAYQDMRKRDPRLENWPEAQFNTQVRIRDKADPSRSTMLFIVKTRPTSSEPNSSALATLETRLTEDLSEVGIVKKDNPAGLTLGFPIFVESSSSQEGMRGAMRGLFTAVRDIHAIPSIGLDPKGANFIAPIPAGLQFQLQVSA